MWVMNCSGDDPILTMEYKCPKCRTFHPAEEIPPSEKQSGKVKCRNCGETFAPSYSGHSIYTVRNDQR